MGIKWSHKEGIAPSPSSCVLTAAHRIAAHCRQGHPPQGPGVRTCTRHPAVSPHRDQGTSGQKRTCRRELLVPGEPRSLGIRQAEVFIITILAPIQSFFWLWPNAPRAASPAIFPQVSFAHPGKRLCYLSTKYNIFQYPSSWPWDIIYGTLVAYGLLHSQLPRNICMLG